MASLRSRCRTICHCHRTGRRSRSRARAVARGTAALPAVHDVATARAANTLFLIGGRLPSLLHLFRTASTTRSFVITMALLSLSLCFVLKTRTAYTHHKVLMLFTQITLWLLYTLNSTTHRKTCHYNFFSRQEDINIGIKNHQKHCTEERYRHSVFNLCYRLIYYSLKTL